MGGRENRGVLFHFTLHRNPERKGSAPFFRWGHREVRGKVKIPKGTQLASSRLRFESRCLEESAHAPSVPLHGPSLRAVLCLCPAPLSHVPACCSGKNHPLLLISKLIHRSPFLSELLQVI